MLIERRADGYTMEKRNGVWSPRFERLADGTLEAIPDDVWAVHDWVDMTEFGSTKRIYRRGRKLVDPDDF